MSPETYGIHELDSLKSHKLVTSVIDFAIANQNPNITVVCKLLQGDNTQSNN